MKNKTMFIIGILVIMLIFGAAVALAKNSSSENKVDKEDHECTPEMMQDMSKNCPEQMMRSAECKNMMDGKEGHNGMGDSITSGNAETQDGEHCEDSGSDMGSMMGSSVADKKGMM